MKEIKWEDFYKITKGRPPWPLLVQAVSLLSNGKDALDLGCGAGRDTRFLLGQGFTVTAVDNDPHAIALLADLPQKHLRAVHSSFEAFDFEIYDLVNAHFALPFMPEEHFHLVFVRIKHALNTDRMTFLTREQAEAELKDLKVLEFREEDVDSHIADGTPKHWHVFHIIAQKGS